MHVDGSTNNMSLLRGKSTVRNDLAAHDALHPAPDGIIDGRTSNRFECRPMRPAAGRGKLGSVERSRLRAPAVVDGSSATRFGFSPRNVLFWASAMAPCKPNGLQGAALLTVVSLLKRADMVA
jgi:hypothetical protein